MEPCIVEVMYCWSDALSGGCGDARTVARLVKLYRKRVYVAVGFAAATAPVCKCSALLRLVERPQERPTCLPFWRMPRLVSWNMLG